jgi:hypothetical protein
MVRSFCLVQPLSLGLSFRVFAGFAFLAVAGVRSPAVNEKGTDRNPTDRVLSAGLVAGSVRRAEAGAPE